MFTEFTGSISKTLLVKSWFFMVEYIILTLLKNHWFYWWNHDFCWLYLVIPTFLLAVKSICSFLKRPCALGLKSMAKITTENPRKIQRPQTLPVQATSTRCLLRHLYPSAPDAPNRDLGHRGAPGFKGFKSWLMGGWFWDFGGRWWLNGSLMGFKSDLMGFNRI